MKELIFITGEKGTGKTTIAKKIFSNFSITVKNVKEIETHSNCQNFIVDGFEKKQYDIIKEYVTRDNVKNIKLILVSNTYKLNDIDPEKRHFDFYTEINCSKKTL